MKYKRGQKWKSEYGRWLREIVHVNAKYVTVEIVESLLKEEICIGEVTTYPLDKSPLINSALVGDQNPVEPFYPGAGTYYGGVNPHENIKRGVDLPLPLFTPFYDLENLPKDEKPKYKTFKIYWKHNERPVIENGLPADVGSLISDGYRIFGFTNDPDWEPGKIWTMYPCDQNRNLKHAIGRLEQ